jgi:hypothetical protein
MQILSLDLVVNAKCDGDEIRDSLNLPKTVSRLARGLHVLVWVAGEWMAGIRSSLAQKNKILVR